MHLPDDAGAVEAAGAEVGLADDDVDHAGVAEHEVVVLGVDLSDEDGGNRLGYVVSRSGDINQTATIDFATTGGTATAGVDYTPVNQTLSFAAGETNKVIWVDVLGDIIPEMNETVAVSIRNPSYGAITTPNTTASILGNDQSIWSISALNASISSIDEVAGNKLFYTILRSGALEAATIEFQTIGGTATAGVDYTPVTQT